ncbi:MAG: hypothetical protein AB7I50_23480 [Vicinamibacterales bacterium]
MAGRDVAWDSGAISCTRFGIGLAYGTGMNVFADARSTNIVCGSAPERAMKWLEEAVWLPGPVKNRGLAQAAATAQGEVQVPRQTASEDPAARRAVARISLDPRVPYSTAA